MIVGFLLNFLCSHNHSYGLGKPGETNKLRQLSITLGAPMFLVTFMIGYLFNLKLILGPKTLFEIAIIALAYAEAHDVECAAKEQLKKQAVLSKIL